MNKKLFTFPVAAIMSIGLVGCGVNNNETAVQDRNNDTIQPVGYYSNENHRGNSGGNVRILDRTDNDGPVTEWMDHTLGNEDAHYRRLQNDGFSKSDMNYHGHLGFNERKPRSSYYEAYDGNYVNQINQAAHVNNVKNVQTLVKGNDVLIAVNLANNRLKGDTIANIRQSVKPYVSGKNVHIVTNPSTFNRIKVIDNDLREGGPRDQINLDIDNIFQRLKKQ
ncbi:spore cortex protein CoxA [Cytobacillus depressus]|uniref:Spore cortex protein CoxA n=1 Tax=Cytobacillus depressus TaxID=1602942 RepID=A0A6L3VGT7_9BACI|nr:YhcN/YlaJ family sporulation lipoprotein [Cytobacillus depressus]KAB2338694.1 spore cortex protein CoxA [Cytobacillus depressus]